ncbi:MAG: L,D-transpeptidase family protein [Peptoniphilaceae bacterium]|uniref:L,D-transpeptidase family protein n=1 Tax=Parvimonas sp. TaxID=1944660 RepID=UPI0025D64624|nr:L,D-transpeptidase family protein [Parvimonas sp.]MCI5997913.1 L,D-transpeptidase/peptidoglycan binding protein [Parvimonas sp.]MDD7764595.1 L,D-transpeptidase family protein [Peptoniphilaceae bacterium]MDY3050571.1 L,D-transpeptidase family protein [Parvimonas sp.]
MIKKSKKVNKNNLTKKILIITGSAFLTIYLFGVILFSFIALPNTKLNGNDISYLMIEDVFNKDWTDFSIKLNRVDGKTDSFKVEKINYNETFEGSKKLLQNQFLWPISFFTSRDVNMKVTVNYDDKKFNEFLTNTPVLKGIKHPEDAKIIFKDGKYVIKDEILGTYTTKDKLKEAILVSILERKNTLDMSTISEQPKITKNDTKLKDALKKYEKLTELKYTLSIGNLKEVLQGETLANIFSFVDDELKPDEQKVKEYVRRTAIKYDTYGMDRKFETTGKGKVEVSGKEGIYGWQIDVNKTTDTLIEKILTFESAEFEPVFIHKGYFYDESGDIGNTYIEIDISRQHMWFYKDGKLIMDTDIVTGDVAKNVETPVGVMKIWSREKDKNLKGLTPQGYDYVSHVDYWMPINWKGVGLHDAPWRNGQFGGDLYKNSGSYGCINTPLDKVKIIYDNVKIDTPVVIYKSN